MPLALAPPPLPRPLPAHLHPSLVAHAAFHRKNFRRYFVVEKRAARGECLHKRRRLAAICPVASRLDELRQVSNQTQVSNRAEVPNRNAGSNQREAPPCDCITRTRSPDRCGHAAAITTGTRAPRSGLGRGVCEPRTQRAQASGRARKASARDLGRARGARPDSVREQVPVAHPAPDRGGTTPLTRRACASCASWNPCLLPAPGVVTPQRARRFIRSGTDRSLRSRIAICGRDRCLRIWRLVDAGPNVTGHERRTSGCPASRGSPGHCQRCRCRHRAPHAPCVGRARLPARRSRDRRPRRDAAGSRRTRAGRDLGCGDERPAKAASGSRICADVSSVLLARRRCGSVGLAR